MSKKEINNVVNIRSTSRASNIELLRVVAITMVLVLHTRYDGILSVYDGIIDASHISRFVFESISIVGVNLFVFISGYFGIRLRKASIANIVFQVYFFACIAFIGLWLSNDVFDPTREDILKLMFPLSHNVWFVPCYFILMLLSPVLNAFIERQNARSLTIYTIVLYSIMYIWSNIWQCVSGFDGYSWGFFIILYFTGAAIKKWESFIEFDRNIAFIGYVLTTLIIVVVAIFQKYYPVGQSLLWAYDSPLVYISSICLFAFFVKLKMQKNRYINILAASSFAVLLFHMSACFRYFDVCQYVYENFSGVMVIFITACVVIVYYFVAFGLDQIRKFIYAKVLKIYNIIMHTEQNKVCIK